MDDLTILYYTANIFEPSGERIRQHLQAEAREIPIISVSQKPMIFGGNIWVGEIGISKYNIYKQIYTGVQAVKTKYVACCEDDVLYNYDHFKYRPKQGIFAYDCNMWFAEPEEFWRRPQIHERSGMFGCIVETQTLYDEMKKRFDKYPQPDPKNYDWGEPQSPVEYFMGDYPLIVFCHDTSTKKKRLLEKHKRNSLPEDHIQSVELYGDIQTLWSVYI